jgi:hypothetical protein
MIPAALDAVAHLHDCWRQQAETCTQLRVRVLVTGSLYLVGGELEVLLSRNALPTSILHLCGRIHACLGLCSAL